jgi:hypothetical protein
MSEKLKKLHYLLNLQAEIKKLIQENFSSVNLSYDDWIISTLNTAEDLTRKKIISTIKELAEVNL